MPKRGRKEMADEKDDDTATSTSIPVAVSLRPRRRAAANRVYREVEEEEEEKEKDSISHVEDNNESLKETNESSDEENSDRGDERDHDNSGEEEMQDEDKRKKKIQTSKRQRVSCERCGKHFSNRYGLQYHMKRNVCQPASANKSSSSKGKRKKSDASGVAFPKIRGKKTDRTCPHCNRVFTSVIGCEYHVRKAVCRKKKVLNETEFFPTLDPGSHFVTPFGVVEVVRDDRAIPVPPKPKTKGETQIEMSDLIDSTESTDDLRDPTDTNTVPLENGTEAKVGDDTGVDFRAEPVSESADDPAAADLPMLLKRYRSALAKRNSQIEKARTAMTVLNLVRRKKLTRNFEQGKIDRDSVWQTQYGKDPQQVPVHLHKRFTQVKKIEIQDPSAPDWSHPDRIVECRWVKDERIRYVGLDDLLPGLDELTNLPDNRPTIFLQRRTLTEKYTGGTAYHACPTCGQKFLSRTGVAYHFKTKKCRTDEEAETDEPGTRKGRNLSREVHLKAWDARATVILRKQDERGGKPMPTESLVAKAKAVKSLLADQQSHDAIKLKGPPQTTSDSSNPAIPASASIEGPLSTPEKTNHRPDKATGVSVRKKRSRSVDDEILVEAGIAALAKTRKEMKLDPDVDPHFEDPREALKKLEKEFRYEQSLFLGPVYPAVVTALRFLKPNAKLKRKRRSKKQMEEDERQEQLAKQREEERKLRLFQEHTEAEAAKIMSKLTPQPDYKYGEFLESLQSRPPMIDTRVLVHEIDLGRYPSINRQAALQRSKKFEVCYVCKSAADPIEKCNFCPRHVHMACARLKYSLRDPEPYDDFLCSHCIQYITHRRIRAEKRRLEKVTGVHVPGSEVSATVMAPKPVPLHRDVEEGKEYEALFSQGRHTANLVELAEDARLRLQREIENSHLSEIRRQMMLL